MQKLIVPTPPSGHPKRKRIFAMRLTDGERAEIKTLARQLNLPASYMARNFILEAVQHHKNQTVEAGGILEA
jgi:hypothetical protein